MKIGNFEDVRYLDSQDFKMASSTIARINIPGSIYIEAGAYC